MAHARPVVPGCRPSQDETCDPGPSAAGSLGANGPRVHRSLIPRSADGPLPGADCELAGLGPVSCRRRAWHGAGLERGTGTGSTAERGIIEGAPGILLAKGCMVLASRRLEASLPLAHQPAQQGRTSRRRSCGGVPAFEPARAALRRCSSRQLAGVEVRRTLTPTPARSDSTLLPPKLLVGSLSGFEDQFIHVSEARIPLFLNVCVPFRKRALPRDEREPLHVA